MNRTTEKNTSGSMGASSILMIFVVLCLTAFGILSLVSARADWRLTQRTVAATEDYYAADAHIQTRLAEIHAVLAAAQKESISDESYLARVHAQLALLEGVTVTEREVSFSTPAGERRSVLTKLVLLPYGEKPGYRLVSRRLQGAEGESLEEDTLLLWQG